MERITLDDQYIQISDTIALRGSCMRAKVGCVIVKEGRIVVTGYNGPVGDACNLVCDINKPCTNAIHAEANAIYFSARNGIVLDGCTIYCNYSPCKKCCEAIKQSGIVRIVYRESYRDTPFDLLDAYGIVVNKI